MSGVLESPFHRQVSDAKQKRFDEKIIESLKALDFAVMLLGLGVDFRRYGKFKSLTPHVFVSMNHVRVVHPRQGAALPAQDDFEFARDFVITTAIHLADFDYDLDWSRAYRAARAREDNEERESGSESQLPLT
jgi:hypothetical protein